MAVLRSLKPGESVRSSAIQGFIARCHRDGVISFEVRRQGRHPIHRVLGRANTMTLPQAEEAARKTLAQHTLARGTEPGKRISLERGWELYREHLINRGRSPNTIKRYEMDLRRLSGNVRKATLWSLAEDPGVIVAEHRRIAVGGHRPAAAATGQAISAVYNFVARRHDKSLPAMNPTFDLDLTLKDPVGGAPVLADVTLPEWWGRVQQLRDPVRVQAHLMLLLSGLRPESLCAMRWDDQADAIWQRPIAEPKGGKKRAFVLIMSQPMQACVQRALVHARGSDWIFPNRDGNQLTKARLEQDARDLTGWWPQDLRRSYATLGVSAGVSDDDIDRFLNHKGVRPITPRYIRTSGLGPHLRKLQETISRYIIEGLGDPELSAAYAEPRKDLGPFGIEWSATPLGATE